jgi:hypothetical protein
MVTLYTYDALDNLTCVEQPSTAAGQTGCSSAPSNDASSAWRIRRFTYDSLGRLPINPRCPKSLSSDLSKSLKNWRAHKRCRAASKRTDCGQHDEYRTAASVKQLR